jgi:hypothetical protein
LGKRQDSDNAISEMERFPSPKEKGPARFAGPSHFTIWFDSDSRSC